MTRTTPRRRITLQPSQMGFTDGLTFIVFLLCDSRLAVRDSSTGEIVRRQFHRHRVARQDADVMHAHFAGYMSQHLMAVLQLHAKHGVGQRFDDGSLHFDYVFFSHTLNRRRSICQRCGAFLFEIVSFRINATDSGR